MNRGVPSFAKVLSGSLGTLLNAFGQTLGESCTKPVCSISFLTPFMFSQAAFGPSCDLTGSPGKCLMRCLFLHAACCETELSFAFHVQHSSPLPSLQWTHARVPLPIRGRLLPCSVFNTFQTVVVTTLLCSRDLSGPGTAVKVEQEFPDVMTT